MPLRQVVPAPPVAPRRVGLLASALTPDLTDERILNGIEFDPAACGPSGAVAVCSPAAMTVADDDNPATVVSDPIVVWAGDRCSTMSNARDRVARARQRLTACESKSIEAEFWQGTTARAAVPDLDVPYLTRNAGGTTAAQIAAVDLAVRDALAALEEYAAGELCGTAMIHAHPNLVTLWDSCNLLRRDGNIVRTIHDSIVVPGAGYDGSGPALADGGAPQAPAADGSQAWAFVTGLVTVYRGPVETIGADERESVLRSTNDRTVIAWRTVVVAHDGCAFGYVSVDLTNRQ